METLYNKILIIGIDDHNTLAIVRELGQFHCDIHILVHGNFNSLREIKIAKSKYAKNRTEFVSDNEEQIIKWVKHHTLGCQIKTIVFPCSDFAEYVIDSHSDELNNCLFPGFKNKPGMVVELMDKIKQNEFAKEHSIPMAKTYKYELLEEFEGCIPFPCILKPEISAKGRKGDIRICYDKREFEAALQMLRNNGYDSVVLQEFLIKDYEVCAFGCIADLSPQVYIGGYIRKLREWPIDGGGNMTASVFIQTDEIDNILNKVLSKLYLMGYRGMYDIEFLVCDNGVYLNEINFRHSGNGFGLIDNGVHAPYYYCKVLSGDVLAGNEKLTPDVGGIIMDEINDFKYRKNHHLSTTEWTKQFFKCSAYSVLNLKDLPGSIAFFGYRLHNLFRKLKRSSTNSI